MAEPKDDKYLKGVDVKVEPLPEEAVTIKPTAARRRNREGSNRWSGLAVKEPEKVDRT
jgi:hypothetical protein